MGPLDKAAKVEKEKTEQCREKLLDTVKSKLAEGVGISEVLDDLVNSKQRIPKIVGMLWWKKYYCPVCDKSLQIASTGEYVYCSCTCGYMWAELLIVD